MAHELRAGERADAGEGRLAERDLPAHPRQQHDGQEDDRIGEPLGEREGPVARNPGETRDEEDGEHCPSPTAQQFLEPVAPDGRRHGRRWRIAGGKGVVVEPPLAQARQCEQEDDEHGEGKRRPEPRREHAPTREVTPEELLDDTEADPAPEGEREAGEAPERCGGDGGDEQVGEVEGLQLREQRSEQHSGKAREKAGKDPDGDPDALGIDAGELDHARALGHGPHPQSDLGEVRHERRQQHDGQGHDDRRQLRAVYGVPCDVEVDRVRRQPQRGRRQPFLAPEDQLERARDRDQHAERAHELDQHRGRADETVEETVHREAQERRRDDDRRQEPGPARPAGVDTDVEDQRRRVRLSPVSEVEHSRGLVSEDEADSHEGEHASVGQARDGIAEKLGHANTDLVLSSFTFRARPKPAALRRRCGRFAAEESRNT